MSHGLVNDAWHMPAHQVLPVRWGLSAELKDSAAENAQVVEDGGGNLNSNTSWHRATRFRAGILQLLLQDHFDVENLGVHLVSSIKGSASQVFDDADTNKSGLLEPAELGALLATLGLDSSTAAVAKAVAAIKNDSKATGGGQGGVANIAAPISKKEFVVWYLTCEERIKDLVGKAFGECDTSGNGRIEFMELKAAIQTLTGRTATDDELWGIYIDLGKLAADQARPSDGERAMKNLTLDQQEFSTWYFRSMFWTERAAELEAAAESEAGIDMFHVPFDKPLDEQIRFVFLAPLTMSLGLTLVNAQDEGKEKYCFYAFFGSIVWIGVSSELSFVCFLAGYKS